MKSSLLSISAENLVYNALTLKDKVGSYYCVLKSDAYGHGATLCASALYEAGMRHFAVFSLDEALEIKPYVNGSDVLILGRTPSRYAEIAFVTPHVSSSSGTTQDKVNGGRTTWVLLSPRVIVMFSTYSSIVGGTGGLTMQKVRISFLM